MGPNFLDCWSEQINNKSHKKLLKKKMKLTQLNKEMLNPTNP